MESQQAAIWRGPLLAAGIGFSAFTSGALASMSLITVPSLLTNTSNAALLTAWRQSLDKGFRIGPPFAIIASLVHFTNAYINRNSGSSRARFLVAAGISSIAILPYTIVILQPTNNELFKREEMARGAEKTVEKSTVDLMKKWGRLNMTRAVFLAIGAGLAGFAI